MKLCKKCLVETKHLFGDCVPCSKQAEQAKAYENALEKKEAIKASVIEDYKSSDYQGLEVKSLAKKYRLPMAVVAKIIEEGAY